MGLAVGAAVVGFAVVGFEVVGFAVVGAAVVGFAVVGDEGIDKARPTIREKTSRTFVMAMGMRFEAMRYIASYCRSG